MDDELLEEDEFRVRDNGIRGFQVLGGDPDLVNVILWTCPERQPIPARSSKKLGQD